ncbi:hypothetical protein RMATCC62417_03177 [Rhizopus microsporus]|nr:hypothetical protein RMATCC62417_03177 [Rhizopus microsporus]
MPNDKPLIKLSVKDWTREQRMAIARVTSQALTNCAMDESWSTDCWNKLLSYLDLTQKQLCALTLDQAIDMLSSQKDIRIDVMLDLVALSIYGHQKAEMYYDARARNLLLELERCLQLSCGDLNAVERSVSQQIYYALQEQQSSSHTDNMGASAKKAVQEGNKKQQALRWVATGAGILGGGAVIALTGGLAAPLLAPLLVGVTGAGFFATAGGVALITSLFGLTGGGLAGWKMHRRMKGIDEFEFRQILRDPDLPPIPSLHCTICISGFLLESANETKTPWEHAFEGKHGSGSDIYCLEYEKKELLDLGYSFKRFVKDSAIKYAGMEVAKSTVLHAFFAAVALPATILKMADVIDNPWQIAVDRSRKAGAVLADVLQQRVHGNRPCSLIAYSCGCLVIWHCLLELYERGCIGIVNHVVLMGAPLSTEDEQEWLQVQSIVSGRFINCYTSNDWVLAYVYRLHSLATSVAGLEAVKIGRIENLEIPELDGHTKYPYIVKDVLDQIKLE